MNGFEYIIPTLFQARQCCKEKQRFRQKQPLPQTCWPSQCCGHCPSTRTGLETHKPVYPQHIVLPLILPYNNSFVLQQTLQECKNTHNYFYFFVKSICMIKSNYRITI